MNFILKYMIDGNLSLRSVGFEIAENLSNPIGHIGVHNHTHLMCGSDVSPRLPVLLCSAARSLIFSVYLFGQSNNLSQSPSITSCADPHKNQHPAELHLDGRRRRWVARPLRYSYSQWSVVNFSPLYFIQTRSHIWLSISFELYGVHELLPDKSNRCFLWLYMYVVPIVSVYGSCDCC